MSIILSLEISGHLLGTAIGLCDYWVGVGTVEGMYEGWAAGVKILLEKMRTAEVPCCHY